DGKRARRLAGRVDYLLRVRVNPGTQPVPLALIEAKAETRPPGHGLEQARAYARRFNVPFVFSSNGHQYAFYNSTTGPHVDPRADRSVSEPRAASPEVAGGDERQSGLARRARLAHPISIRRDAPLLSGRRNPRRVREGCERREARAARTRDRRGQDFHR